ncbi:hypothetical protein L615_001100000240 [Nocardioides sp. J9]|uniref:hypothetical protein n=1 Tax=Nocardioides sp. J9 TaxID=935844 RepID=UPI0011A18262|nr:hypothetical protein [Nocardioides sp. J9]TWH03869.1 hypothetical protein L615_001100000240 [Nocardioides sp. J9]
MDDSVIGFLEAGTRSGDKYIYIPMGRTEFQTPSDLALRHRDNFPAGKTSAFRRLGRGRIFLARGVTLCLVISALAVGNIFLAGPAAAHCPDPGNNGHRYVSGGNQVVLAESVRFRVEWMTAANQDVCNSGASYSASLTRSLGTSDPAWLQVGWRYYDWYVRPMGYCERHPRSSGTGSYALSEYSVTQQKQVYAYLKNDSSQFLCRIDGETLRTTHEDFVGFRTGNWMPVQAEAHARHVQLGRVAPSWLRLDIASRVRNGGSGWEQMNVNGVHRDDTVYNFTQPEPDGFWVNTDASH